MLFLPCLPNSAFHVLHTQRNSLPSNVSANSTWFHLCVRFLRSYFLPDSTQLLFSRGWWATLSLTCQRPSHNCKCTRTHSSGSCASRAHSSTTSMVDTTWSAEPRRWWTESETTGSTRTSRPQTRRRRTMKDWRPTDQILRRRSQFVTCWFSGRSRDPLDWAVQRFWNKGLKVGSVTVNAL